ncbi:hypothetical protein MMUC44124_15300 [Mycolicibacterium mucogenicum DSM 44124]|nr:hypothetical protein MMUC44124_15300 [Mycolicibacterium mucogenicum DSM 44124]
MLFEQTHEVRSVRSANKFEIHFSAGRKVKRGDVVGEGGVSQTVETSPNQRRAGSQS